MIHTLVMPPRENLRLALKDEQELARHKRGKGNIHGKSLKMQRVWHIQRTKGHSIQLKAQGSVRQQAWRVKEGPGGTGPCKPHEEVSLEAMGTLEDIKQGNYMIKLSLLIEP